MEVRHIDTVDVHDLPAPELRLDDLLENPAVLAHTEWLLLKLSVLLEVPFGELLQRGRTPIPRARFGGISARGHFALQSKGLLTSAFRRPRRAMAADRDAALPSALAVL